MDGKARLGRAVLIAVIVVTALGELATAALSLRVGRFPSGQVGRVILTGWLLWRAWDGASWARWLVAALLLVGGVALMGVGFGSSGLQGRASVQAILAATGAVFAALGVGVASPWMGAYQVARRGPDV